MMEKHFMVDIESTGVDIERDEILQVGILEVTWAGRQWEPGRNLEFLIRSERQPESAFAKEHMADLYRRCNEVKPESRSAMRNRILGFFLECGAKNVNETYLMGWNASNFDVPFLVAWQLLRPSRYETQPDGTDKMVGDFHYRIYEIGGAVSLVQNLLNAPDRNGLLERARAAFPIPPEQMPAGKPHDALYDCYSQLQLLNGLLCLARVG